MAKLTKERLEKLIEEVLKEAEYPAGFGPGGKKSKTGSFFQTGPDVGSSTKKGWWDTLLGRDKKRRFYGGKRSSEKATQVGGAEDAPTGAPDGGSTRGVKSYQKKMPDTDRFGFPYSKTAPAQVPVAGDVGSEEPIQGGPAGAFDSSTGGIPAPSIKRIDPHDPTDPGTQRLMGQGDFRGMALGKLANDIYQSVKKTNPDISIESGFGKVIHQIVVDLLGQMKYNNVKLNESNNIYYDLLSEAPQKSKMPKSKAKTYDLDPDFKPDPASAWDEPYRSVPSGEGEPEEPDIEFEEPFDTGIVPKEPMDEPEADPMDFPTNVDLPKGPADLTEPPLPPDVQARKDAPTGPTAPGGIPTDPDASATKYAPVHDPDAPTGAMAPSPTAVDAVTSGEGETSWEGSGASTRKTKGEINLTQAIGNKLAHSSIGLNRRDITAIIQNIAKPYFQKLLKQRGKSNITLRESKAIDVACAYLIEDVVRGMIKENKNKKKKTSKVSSKRKTRNVK